MNRSFNPNRRAMTLVDVMAAICIGVVLITLGAGCLSGNHEQANRIKCANNLRLIGQAAMMYSFAEVRTGAFPRTYFDPDSTKLIVDTTGYGKPRSFDPAIGANNVTASFYLILKTQDITPDVFICPSTAAVRGFGPGTTPAIQDSSNWEKIPGNVTYSYACPFATQDAISNGWKFNNTLGSDCPLAADLNPGGNALLTLTPASGAGQMSAGNSHNHGGEGQEVVYCDGHVEFQNTPFCGRHLDDKPTSPQDNIYTSGGPSAAKGGDAVVAMPATVYDAVLLPTGDANAGK